MKLRTLFGALLVAMAGSASAGTFSSLALLLPYTVTSSSFGGGLVSGVVDVNPPGPHAFFALSVGGSLSLPAGGGSSSGGSVSVSAQFNLFWTQTTLGETPPALIYEHHSVTSVAHESFTVPRGGTALGQANMTGIGGCSVLDAGPPHIPSSFLTSSGAGSNVVTWVPTWTYVSTDALGFITYVVTTPVITSGTASASISINNTHGISTAMGMASCAATDNFYFDVI